MIDKIFRLLRPSGVFISNTARIADIFLLFKLIGPIDRFSGRLPYLIVSSAQHLGTHLTKAGFTILRDFQANIRDALFLVARKPAEVGNTHLSAS